MTVLEPVKVIIRDGLAEGEELLIEDGPEIPASMPGRCVVLTLSGGPGTITEEGLFEGLGFQARCIGEQMSYLSAEMLAFQIDRLLKAVRTRNVGDVRVLSIARVGSPPSPLMVDDADRHHFVASYVATVGSP